MLSVYLLLLFIANATPARHYLADAASSYLHDKLHTQVHIESVELGLFNRLTLKNVYIEDQKRKPLLQAKIISAKISLRSLFQECLNLRTVSLIDANALLYKEKKNGPTNFQFIIDAFKSKEKKKSSGTKLRIGSIIIRRSRLAYDELFKLATPGIINSSHLSLSGINANVSLKRLAPDSLNLRVRSFSFKEKSGLDLRALRFRLTANSRGCILHNFSLELPNSVIDEQALNFHYDARRKGGDMLKTLSVEGRLERAVLSARDFAFVQPRLKDFNSSFKVNLMFRVTPRSISFPRISIIEREKKFSFTGDAWLALSARKVSEAMARVGSMHADIAFIKAVAKLASKDMKVPAVLSRIPSIDFHGSAKLVDGKTSFAQGTLSSHAGSIYASLHWHGSSYTLQSSTDRFSPSVFFGNEKLPDDLSFQLDSHLDLRGGRISSGDLSTIINRIAYKGHVYSKIQANAALENYGRLSFRADVADPLLSFTTDAEAHLSGMNLERVAATLSLRSFSPHSLGMTPKFSGKTFAANLRADVSLRPGSLPDGDVQVSDFTMSGQQGENYRVSNFHLKSSSVKSGKHLALRSDFLDLEAEGPADFSQLKSSLLTVLSESVPALSRGEDQRGGGRWTLWANLRDSRFFNEIFGLPLHAEQGVHLNAHLQTAGRSSLTCYGDRLGWGGMSVKDFRLYGESAGKDLRLIVQGSAGRDDALDFSVEASSNPHGIFSQILWKNASASRFSGELKSQTTVTRGGDNKINARLQILPTTINIGDTVWSVVPGSAELRDKAIVVNGIGLEHANQVLKLFGNLSDLRSDSIFADLKDIDVGYILDLVNLKPVSFGGRATGRVSLSKDSEGKLQAGAQLSIPHFEFNGGEMGASLIKGVWRQSDGRLWLSASMNDKAVGAQTDVDGYVGIAEKRLDLNIRSVRTNMHFLRRYVSSIFPAISGRTSGQCRIYGPFKKLDFEGHETASVDLTVPATGARYSLKDVGVDMSHGLFSFEGGDIADSYGGAGHISGSLRHDHLKNLRYDFRFDASRLLLYDRLSGMGMPFQARAFGNGSAHLFGKPGTFTADIDIAPTEGTLFNYTLSSPESYEDVKFLTIRPKADALPATPADTLKAHQAPAGKQTANGKEHAEDNDDEDEGTTDIRLNMQIAMNPNVPINIIMDERTGDMLTVYGSGTLRANFYNKGSFQLFGTYQVERGQYHVSLQNLIRKDFRLDTGGRITFSGTPTDAALNLKAIYTVPSASLSDLGIAALQTSAPVRVNCILNITGNASAPQVGFDLDLPTVSADVKQMVRQTISTDEDMNMQIIYLLGIGRFYTYDNRETTSAASASQNRSGAAVNSFLSSTLSSQLNDVISGALGRGSNWTLGTNLTTGEMGWNDLEVGGLLSGRLLNNRLLINGNFGYRDKAYNGGTTNFVGDFDINYLITPSGTVSLKAYSETNDRYFSKSSLTTQGIGIKLQKDFKELRQLFSPKRKKSNSGKKHRSAQ